LARKTTSVDLSDEVDLHEIALQSVPDIVNGMCVMRIADRIHNITNTEDWS